MAQSYKVPLTDPRLDLYTDELLMIEMAFLKKEQPDLFKGENYHDPLYEERVRKAIAEESRIIRDDKDRAGKLIPEPQPAETLDLDDTTQWEPVD